MSRGLARVAPAGLLVALAVAVIVPQPGWLRLGGSTEPTAERMEEALGAVPSGGSVLVGFDPDLGTYAEIRPTVRAVLDELAARRAAVRIVSLTGEGRALAVAELARLPAAADAGDAVDDLGFIAGAEAALVDLAEDPPPVDALLVVGGNDLGPRVWVEQYLPRVPDLPVLAIAPAVLLPETRPYLATGQLDAAVLTPGDGAALRAALGTDVGGPAPLAVLVGLVIAIVVLGQALVSRLAIALRAARPRDAT